MSRVPAVSVLLPTYNNARFLAAAVESVLAQSFGDFELIVVDDGSADGTPDVLAGFHDPRLAVVRHGRNLGITPALNRGLAQCRADLVARMDGDDLSEPDRFRRQADFLARHPDHALVGSNALEMDDAGRVVGLRERPLSHEEVAAHLIERGNAVVHGSAMFRRQAVADLGGYREPLRLVEDYDLWLRLSERARLANLPEPLYRHRIGNDLDSRRYLRQQAAAEVARQLAVERRRTGADPLDGPDRGRCLDRLHRIAVGDIPGPVRCRAWRDLAQRHMARRSRWPALKAALAAVLAGGLTRDNLHVVKRTFRAAIRLDKSKVTL
jgi:glycosyltransferase involved in cell wall biosynthesis